MSDSTNTFELRANLRRKLTLRIAVPPLSEGEAAAAAAAGAPAAAGAGAAAAAGAPAAAAAGAAAAPVVVDLTADTPPTPPTDVAPPALTRAGLSQRLDDWEPEAPAFTRAGPSQRLDDWDEPPALTRAGPSQGLGGYASVFRPAAEPEEFNDFAATAGKRKREVTPCSGGQQKRELTPLMSLPAWSLKDAAEEVDPWVTDELHYSPTDSLHKGFDLIDAADLLAQFTMTEEAFKERMADKADKADVKKIVDLWFAGIEREYASAPASPVPSFHSFDGEIELEADGRIVYTDSPLRFLMGGSSELDAKNLFSSD